MVEGWIKLHRIIVTKDIYVKPPLYLRTFERLILEANHICKRIPYNKTTKLVRRGERLTSIRQIAEWVAWYERGVLKVPNPKTIAEILKWLVENDLIEILNKGNSQETHYSIVNYSFYQAVDDYESNAKVTVTGEVSIQQLDTNKNVNNISSSCSTELTPLQKVNKYFQENFRLSGITPAESVKVIDWMDNLGFEADCIIHAMEIAVLRDRRYLGFVEGVLRNYESAGIKSRGQAEEYQRKWDAEKKQQQGFSKKSTSSAGNTQQKKNGFNNFENRKYDFNALEDQLLAKSRGELNE